MSVASKVIDQMYNNDPFSKWLKIERLEESEGYCKLKMVVTRDMLNGFAVAHGGISYSLADSALAFASNSYGTKAMSIETSISHTRPLKEGDIIVAEATELNRTKKIGVYQVQVINQNKEIVALFKGTVYISDKSWDV